jgi:hypothetical protein
VFSLQSGPEKTLPVRSVQSSFFFVVVGRIKNSEGVKNAEHGRLTQRKRKVISIFID